MRRGTIIKRGKSYSVVLDIGRDMETGRRRRRWHSGFRTRREAERALTELLGRLDKGTYVEPSRQTLAEFVEDWLPAIRGTIRTSTWESYAANLRAHVLPVLGSVQLQALGPAQLNRLYADLRESGRRDGRGGLSPKTVRYCHTIVRRLLRDAVKWGKLTRNVADSADPPKQTARRREMKTWRADELRSFLESARDNRLYPAWLVLSTTGMRRGELLGLRWQDVELEAGRLSIRQSLVASGKYEPRFEEPKTDRGRRSIPLPPEATATLRSWRAQQAQERLQWGPAWTGQRAPLHPRGRHPPPPGPVLQALRQARAGSRSASHPAPRPPAHLRNPRPLRRGTGEGRLGDPGARLHRDHLGRVLPRRARVAGGRNGEGCRTRLRRFLAQPGGTSRSRARLVET